MFHSFILGNGVYLRHKTRMNLKRRNLKSIERNFVPRSLLKLLLIFGFIVFVFGGLQAQKPTRVSGKVVDAQTNLPLAFVNVYFKNSNVGATTDLDGNYSISTRWATDSLQASFIGYNTLSLAVRKSERQSLNFSLQPTSLNLEAVTIQAKKEKYSKKNNPAVDLIRKVMSNRSKNHLDGKPFYTYDKYEKVELSINNITQDFMDRKIFNSFGVLWDYIDTSKINGKPFLPMFLRESLSTVYYRKNPKTEREYRNAIKYTDFYETIDEQSISDVIDLLYHDVDIYDNTIDLLDHQFVSPLAPIAVNFYRFYIIDTLAMKGDSVINLAFIPRNKSNIGFTGNLYVSHDDEYSVRKIDFTIIGGINLNFVRDLRIIQEFEPYEESFILTKDELTIDYSISKNSLGFFGTRSVTYDKFDFDKPPDPEVFGGFENIIIAEDAYKYSNDFWDSSRFEPLNKNEAGVYEMVDSLKRVPEYQKLVYVIRVLTTGYVPIGPVDIGPILVTLSFNDVEGARLRFGGETNFNLSKRLFFELYGAYGFKDDAYKYAGGVTYTFKEDYKVNPRHFLYASYQKETSFPGQELQFVNEDNFLLSFKRGDSDKMLFSDSYRLDYVNEGQTFQFGLAFENKRRKPYGTLSWPFEGVDGTEFLEDIQTTEVGLNVRFAPNEQFIQGRQYRTPIINEFPVINIWYKQGIPDFLGGDYSYRKVQVSMFKRFNWSVFGHTNIELEGGKIWGEVPYILLHIPRANQTYAYQIRSYNMMNFLEFASDSYFGLNMQHFFHGFIFNKIPLFKKLKLREVITLKMLYGSLSDSNNPNLNSQLVQFPTNAEGEPIMFTLEGEPYIEGSFGLLNIFRFLRVDFVKRFTYLDNPKVPNLWGVNGLGIRARIRVEF